MNFYKFYICSHEYLFRPAVCEWILKTFCKICVSFQQTKGELHPRDTSILLRRKKVRDTVAVLDNQRKNGYNKV